MCGSLKSIAPIFVFSMLLACHGGSLVNTSGAPSITMQPVSHTVIAGTPVTLTVAASGNPAPAFTWERLNIPMGWWDIALFDDPTGTYTFTPQLTDNGALLRAVAFNGTATSSVSAAATISVVSGYAPGYSTSGLGVKEPGYWMNGVWNALTPLSTAYDSMVNAIVVSGGDVQAGGYSTYGSGVKRAGYWSAGTWVALTPVPEVNDSMVEALAIQ